MAKILVIDDNADLLQMMRLILQGRGNHEVILSADGADGLSRAVTNPPDLAIIDVMMPGITGYDVVRRLREHAQTAEMPILILTARGQMIDRQTALQAGANDHMAKPVTPQALLEKVDELLTLRGTPSAGGDGGKVVSLLSLRGGVGVTTLAVNLALVGVRVLRTASQGQADADATPVCLVDLSPASGQGTLHLRLSAQKTWAALPGLGVNPSLNDLTGLLTAHPSGLQLLAAPFEPTFASTLSAALVEGALGRLGSRFGFVVVDIPPLLDVVAASALDVSDRIVLVLTPEVGAIQAAVAMLQVMDEVQEKLMVVLNHISPQPGLPEVTIEKALHRPITLKVPYDPAQVAALRQGKPLAWAQPSSPLAEAVGQLMGMLS
jgi:pilus assembly protein CpaE